ncbi:MAG: hypothetical protein ACYS8Z_12345 [Planctomycetota bacterium]
MEDDCGGTTEGGKSYDGKPPCETIVAGDINGDCRNDFRDFQFIALHWLNKNNPQRTTCRQLAGSMKTLRMGIGLTNRCFNVESVTQCTPDIKSLQRTPSAGR